MDESIFHILNSCSHLSVSMYLPVRHNEVAKVIYYEILNGFQNIEEDRKTPESTLRTTKLELWWDKKIAVQPPVEHNRPDIVLWDLEKKTCTVIDIYVPMDVNVAREEKEKCDRYFLLASIAEIILRIFIRNHTDSNRINWIRSEIFAWTLGEMRHQ